MTSFAIIWWVVFFGFLAVVLPGNATAEVKFIHGLLRWSTFPRGCFQGRFDLFPSVSHFTVLSRGKLQQGRLFTLKSGENLKTGLEVGPSPGVRISREDSSSNWSQESLKTGSRQSDRWPFLLKQTNVFSLIYLGYTITKFSRTTLLVLNCVKDVITREPPVLKYLQYFPLNRIPPGKSIRW